jgi:hypothetical protein
MVKRTKKEFTEYNDYHDRGMEYKWDTAFALGELQEEISTSKADSKRNIPRLPQQSRKEIEQHLECSIKYNKVLDIQLNTLDSLGRVQPHIWGVFRGATEDGQLLIGDLTIDYEDIRHIKSFDFQKWNVQTNKTEDENPFI